MYISLTTLGRFVPAVTIKRFCNLEVSTIRMAQTGELVEVTVEEAQRLIRQHYAEAIPETEQEPESEAPKRKRGRPAKRRKSKDLTDKEADHVNLV